ncbi:bestrophin-like domain [Rhodopseudomonas sp. NSM]|uniref:bestrophin-like domain n=1 Tax=Rhodopseudomonas sp. NSM TaxID=3457630 RepID=UPI004035FB42
MIRAWLDLPTYGTFVTLALLYYGVALALVVLTCASPLRGPVSRLNGIVAPFFSSVAVLFGLLTGFLGYDVTERNRQASRAVQAEAGELQNLYTLSVASVTDMRDIRIALKGYASSVLLDEWPAAHGESAPRTNAAYDVLLNELSEPAISRDASAAVHVAMLSAAVRVGTARNARLSLSTDRTSDLKWISVLLLGVITQVALTLVHLDKPRAMLAALTVFGTGAIVALGMIALQEDPFGGVFRVSPKPIERLLALPDTVAPPAPAQPPATAPPSAAPK